MGWHQPRKSAKSVGIRMGWLSARQAQALLNTPDITTTEGAARSRHFGGSPGLRPPAV
jgi:hypothetical protein